MAKRVYLIKKKKKMKQQPLQNKFSERTYINDIDKEFTHKQSLDKTKTKIYNVETIIKKEVNNYNKEKEHFHNMKEPYKEMYKNDHYFKQLETLLKILIKLNDVNNYTSEM